MSDPTETQLLVRVQKGDQTALGELLSRHQRQLYNTCLRMVNNADDAAEVTQDAMLKIVEHIGDFNGQSAITTWMTRITMNLAISHLRKRKLRLTTSLDGSGSRSPRDDDQSTPLREQLAGKVELSPDSRIQKKEMLELLHQALGRLDEEFRAVLVLRDIQEMDYEQIAGTLSIPVGTVKSRLFRARLALRQQMAELEGSGRLGKVTTG